MPRELSSRWTFTLKYLFPTFWSGTFGASTVLLWAGKMRDSHGQPAPLAIQWVFLVIWIFGSLFFIRWSTQLKRVSLDNDTTLLISNFRTTIRVPIEGVAEVIEHKWQRGKPITLRLKVAGAFGDRIFFLPKTEWNLCNTHPVVNQLRELISGSPPTGGGLEMRIEVQLGSLAICRLDPRDAVPDWALRSPFFSVTRTLEELSVVCAQSDVPLQGKVELGWRSLKVLGPLDFGLTGVLASLVVPLAAAQISIFALSTFDTDYLLVKEGDLASAIAALSKAGHVFEKSI